MEQKDAQNVGHDREGLSRRRLSSILKAPRMSMKVCGNDQDENQDETRPIEKRRNSRRVSFATTSNVRVFPKDLKAEPVLAPIQNLAVGENMTQSFDTSVKHELTGLDTMLTKPIHFELNKENFFPDPSLPVDKTVLLGEDTGYMDMTYSHTVLLEKEEELYPEFTLNMSNISESHKLNIPTDLPSKTFNTMEKGVMQSQFDDFLASLSKTDAENVPKKNHEQFSLENISKIKTGEENIPASCFTEVAHLGRDDMDITDIHPVMSEEAFQHFPYSVGGNRRSADTTSSTNYLVDMELTRNQTHTINFKGSVNINRSMSGPDQKKCTFVCDDPSEMILTEVLDEYVQGQEQLSEQNRFQSSTSFAPIAHSDQKEVLGSQTAVSAAHDQSDFMELTCQASTEVLSRIHDGSMLAERSNIAIGSKRNSETYATVLKPQESSVPQLSDPGKIVKRVGLFKREVSLSCMVDGSEMRRRSLCDDTDRTPHTVCDDMDLTRQTVCDDMDLTRQTVCNDMDLTRQTVCE
ncbi:Kinetochore scaffold 1 [Bagarius yarrelli]|uniref:Kinetochore scaffold 1 n=1 Tax=Bagarius yarrelli TaxID=175774 RepID=A0A556TKA7_BAGYA|nr:Kinetochore scaffold 1 [Bagarius yarrelli]